MPMIVAPIAGALSDRIGGAPHHRHRARAAGDRPRVDRGGLDPDDAVQRARDARSRSRASAWRSSSRRSRTSSSRPCAPRRRDRRRARTTPCASSAACFGVAVLASVFAHYGGYTSGESFVDGMKPPSTSARSSSRSAARSPRSRSGGARRGPPGAGSGARGRLTVRAAAGNCGRVAARFRSSARALPSRVRVPARRSAGRRGRSPAAAVCAAPAVAGRGRDRRAAA